MSIALPSPLVPAERSVRGLLTALSTTVGPAHHGRHAVTWAVDASREAITTAARTGGVHGWVEALELDDVTVDHLVLDASGILLVQSAWHDTALTETDLTELAAAASAAATKTGALVRERRCSAPVRAAVVVWGAAEDDVPAGGFVTGGALVLRGADLADLIRWSAHAGGSVTFDEAADLLIALEDVETGDRVVSTVR